MKHKSPSSAPYTFVDLFAGAGGMALGFVQAGFKPVLAVEMEEDFAKTYRANIGDHVVSDDIRRIAAQPLPRGIDVVIGGPPCQGFSNLTGNRHADPRREMWQYFMDVVERSRCKVFVIENVPNLLKSPEVERLIARAERLGYRFGPQSVGILLASQFGVPQNRRRAFLIGSRLAPAALPQPTSDRMTVAEAFRGIPAHPLHDELPRSPASGSDLHIGRNPTAISLARYKLIPEGGNRFDLQRQAPQLTPPCWIKKTSGGTDLFGRLEWDSPARCTVRCEFYKPEKGRYLHPTEDRPITHWEAARLQTFPDTFKWHGTRIRIAIQIGNAVPPVLAEAVARVVHKHLDHELAKAQTSRLRPVSRTKARPARSRAARSYA